MTQHYLFFVRDTLPQLGAHLVQIVNCANAAANLGYSAVLVYLQDAERSRNPINWLVPFQPHPPDPDLAQFYNLQNRLQVVALPMPPAKQWKRKWLHPSTLVSKYYFPIHLRSATRLVHTRDWNFVKAAVKNGVPAIYERDHYEQKRYEPEIVNHPLFQLTVTVADTVKQDLINNGMPPEKIIKLHNGFNRLFLQRHPDAAQQWRQQLLQGRSQLVVYAGALYPFKGVDLLIEVAAKMPQVQFAIAGGTDSQIATYRQLIQTKQLTNVTILGFLQQNQLASLLQAADALAHPHLSGEAANFTSPMKLFDYLASGTPIVATEIPPLMEFRNTGAIAAWCVPDNPDEFACSLRQVLSATTKQIDIQQTETAATQFIQQFSWENRIATILNHIDPAYHPVRST
jgi:glycosyltransferase involved in cell wall biosynthesis